MHFAHLLVAAALFGGAQLGTDQTLGPRVPATPPLPRSVASPVMARRMGIDGQRIQITTDDKRTLVGSYYAPKDSKKLAPAGLLAPAALLVPDAGGKRGDLAELADRLQKQGFAVLSIDVRAHGDSVGADKPWAELNDADKLATWHLALGDIKAAVKFLGAQAGVQTTNVSLLGSRAGCTLVTRHAKEDENVHSVVMVDPPSTETFGFNLERDVASLGSLPTLIAVTNATKSTADDLAKIGEKANNGTQFIEIALFKGVSTSPVVDKDLPKKIANFMDSKANKKKGD